MPHLRRIPNPPQLLLHNNLHLRPDQFKICHFLRIAAYCQELGVSRIIHVQREVIAGHNVIDSRR